MVIGIFEQFPAIGVGEAVGVGVAEAVGVGLATGVLEGVGVGLPTRVVDPPPQPIIVVTRQIIAKAKMDTERSEHKRELPDWEEMEIMGRPQTHPFMMKNSEFVWAVQRKQKGPKVA